MSQPLWLRGARQLLTLRGEPGVRRDTQSGNLEIIEDGSVFIQDGKIVSVGTTRRLENLKEIRGAIVVPVQNCVVMPGFIDSSIELGLVSPTAKRRKLSDFYNECLTLMRSCLMHGTLNASIRARSGVTSKGADLSLLRQLARVRSHPVGISRIWVPGDAASGLDMVARRGLAESVALKAGDPRLAEANAAKLAISLDCMEGSCQQLKESLDQIRPASVLCHYNLSAEERHSLAKSRAVSIFKAGGTLLDRLPVAGVRELIDEGGAIALGSGYDAVHEPNFNMQLVLALAVRRLGLTIEEAIVAMTINAAYAMNCGDQIGSLEPGKRADLLVLSLPDYREIPRRMGVNHVAMAIGRGEISINRTKWRVGAA